MIRYFISSVIGEGFDLAEQFLCLHFEYIKVIIGNGYYNIRNATLNANVQTVQRTSILKVWMFPQMSN